MDSQKVVVVPEYAANGSRLCRHYGWGVCTSRLSIFGGRLVHSSSEDLQQLEWTDVLVQARESLGYSGLHHGNQLV
ncbi:hypothetical protein Tco_1001604 [Tanacetum coccineum]